METCGVHEKTALRYLRERKAPDMACKLLDLYGRGRVLPESGNHCFINQSGNLEIYQVGEISMSEITNTQWAKQLYKSHTRTLEQELEKAKAQIKRLEHFLAEAPSPINSSTKNKLTILRTEKNKPGTEPE